MDFLAHVQLSPVEQAMLTPSDQPFEISAEFFDVLTRIQRVRDECRSLQVLILLFLRFGFVGVWFD
jgi:hypothetical protein